MGKRLVHLIKRPRFEVSFFNSFASGIMVGMKTNAGYKIAPLMSFSINFIKVDWK